MDFYFTNKLPSNIAVQPQGANNITLNTDQAEAADPTFFAADPLQPGEVHLLVDVIHITSTHLRPYWRTYKD